MEDKLCLPFNRERKNQLLLLLGEVFCYQLTKLLPCAVYTFKAFFVICICIAQS